ncbi:N-glycosyltransferase [Rubripirellula obstinata]|uniref:N-glycosyltransferase n=1 Tax=Rubripirellula obstinata TaxID=406547 RepID=A0A5B1CFH9_9BACT|nr:glycosyltransferase family 2 protein [Rubripirellula obstinata]KAA1259958.1 N-glycosyltransferase [Rubripirellula obstinata]
MRSSLPTMMPTGEVLSSRSTSDVSTNSWGLQTNQHPKPCTPSVWIVIAAYNESERIGRTLADLKAKGFHHVIVVDDGSRDGTAAVAAQASEFVLRHPINCGQGAALQTGIDFALGQSAILSSRSTQTTSTMHRRLDDWWIRFATALRTWFWGLGS